MEFNPHGYQQYGVQRIVEEPFIALFWEMGLGKTVVTLTAVNELKYNRWAVRKALVVAPKKVAEATWQKEAASWEHLRHLRFSTVMGGEQRRIKALCTPADVYVIGRDSIDWLVDYYRNDWPFDMVILDESTSFKNHSSKRFRAIKAVRPRIRRLVELTGTPSPNGLEDLWAQVYLLDQGERLGKTISSYREMFFTQDYSRPGQVYRTYSPQDDAQDKIQRAISDICISLKSEDHLELPPFIRDDIPVVLDSKAQKDYTRLERELILQVDEQTITAGTAAVLNGKLLQLCSGAVYDDGGSSAEIHRCKLDAFLEVLERLEGEHALVFYWFRHEAERILGVIPKGKRVRVYTGAADEAAWNAGEIDILLAHPASCGYGLNLQHGGHHAIWYTLPNWTLELYQQANKRLHRQGQTQPVIVHHLLVQGGVDEDMAASLDAKSGVQDAMMRALKARIEKVRGDLA